MNNGWIAAAACAAAALVSKAEPFMPDVFGRNAVVLFQGDSITHGGRLGDMNHYLGHGYQAEIAMRYLAYRPAWGLEFANRGESGHTSSNLVDRWHRDAVPFTANACGEGGVFNWGCASKTRVPDVLSILIGINDYTRVPPWRTTRGQYEANLRFMVTNSLAANPKMKIVLAEPFRLPVNPDPDFCRRQAAVAEVAHDHGLPCVPYQKLYSEDLMRLKPWPRYWFWDVFHPTYAGHMKMADFWLACVEDWQKGECANEALVPRGEIFPRAYDWYQRHANILTNQVASKCDVAFVGDGLFHDGTLIAATGARRALNLGFAGDRTESVLWRLGHGELDGTLPRAVVVSAGRENLKEIPGRAKANTSGEIAAAVCRIKERILEKCPGTKVVVCGLAPAGRDGQSAAQGDRKAGRAAALARELAETNRLLDEALKRDTRVTFLNAPVDAKRLAPLLP